MHVLPYYNTSPAPRVTWNINDRLLPTWIKVGKSGTEIEIPEVGYVDAGKYECGGFQIKEITTSSVRFNVTVECRFTFVIFLFKH